MKDVLEEIVAWKQVELARFKEVMPATSLHAQVEEMLQLTEPYPSMRESLMCSSSGIIAEFKRKSPSKGWIKELGRPDVIPLSYQQNGASALSILTDEKFFGGSDRFIVKARSSGVTLPILYKNFVVDEYQLFQAKVCGASAILLIAACLSKPVCKKMIDIAHELEMEVLLEMHHEKELDYADLEPDMYGINNRNLGTFITDLQNSYRLAAKLPAESCKVSESGISNVSTIRELREIGFRGFLIGETFMRADNPGEALGEFISQI